VEETVFVRSKIIDLIVNVRKDSGEIHLLRVKENLLKTRNLKDLLILVTLVHVDLLVPAEKSMIKQFALVYKIWLELLPIAVQNVLIILCVEMIKPVLIKNARILA
jgi:hypothetical protein